MKNKKLKTLKDIDGNGVHGDLLEYDRRLKQEAIKWIKEFQKERTDAISEMFDNVDDCGIYPTTKFFNKIDNFWLNKFNLTSEDLK